jgi:hypothetical protein
MVEPPPELSDRECMLPRVARLALLAAIEGCYNPSPLAGGPCASNGICPDPLVCDFGQSPPMCNTHQTDAATSTPAGHDAADLDASTADAPSADAPPSRAPRLVQQATAGATSGEPTITLLRSPTAGSVLVVAAGAGQAPLDGISGGGVTTWHPATASAVDCNEEIWYGTTDGSSASVTLRLANNVRAIFGSVTEWSGLAPANTLDIATATSGASSPATTRPFTTRHASDLLFFSASTISPVTWGTVTPGPWTALLVVNGGECAQAAWYRFVTAADSYTPSVTESGSFAWDAAAAAFIVSP